MDSTRVEQNQQRKNNELMTSAKRSDGLKRCRGYLVSKGGEKFTLNTFREAASHESFLETLFELFDEDGDGLIDQDEFLRPFHQQLTDEKGRHFCEILETATYAIAHEQFLRLPIFLTIFSTKRLLDKLFAVMDKNGDNLVSINDAMDFLAKLTVAQTPTSLTKENLDYLENLFINHCNENNEITLENFRKIIKSKNRFFTERVFHIFDRDGSGTVSRQEFLDSIGKFAGQSMDSKIKFLFDIYDQDGDGRVQMCELRQVIKACMDENGMEFSEEQLDDLTTALFEDADPNATGAITVETLKAQLEKHEGLVENLSYSIEKWLVPPRPENKTYLQNLKTSVPHQLSWGYMKNNQVFLVFFFAFIALNIALFATRMWQYRESNAWIMVARGCGQCLNFTCMFILVMMLRKSITWLRARGVSFFLPLDEHIYMHKLTGWLIFIYSVGHTIAHVGNLVVTGISRYPCNDDDDKKVVNGTITCGGDDDDDDDDKGYDSSKVLQFVVDWLFTDASGTGWIGHVAYPTGVALLVILIIMIVCSLPFVRKSGKFEVFYWTHRLYIAFFILCFIHGPRFWHWFIAPCAIYVIEMIFRVSQRKTGHGRTYITEAVLLPSKVTHLVIKRPPNFHFHPGDYVFVKVPTIAKYEWHPFTISSAPEQPDVIWLHIRGVGEWTNQLNSHINKEFQAILATQTPPPPAIEPPAPKRENIFTRGSRYIRRSAKLKLNADNGNAGLSSNPQGYQHMSSTFTNSTESIVMVETADSSQSLKPPDKLKVTPVKSLPIFDKDSTDDHKMLARSRSHRIESSGDVSFSPIPGTSTVCMRTRSRGQSFKHMRRKPKVLPMPGLSTAIIHEEVEEESKGKTMENSGNKDNLETVLISSGPSSHQSDDDQLEIVTLHVPTKKPVEEVALRERAHTLQTAGSRTSFVCYDPASDSKPLEIVIDGPYGAPSSHIFRAEHAVLVGTGIGVTPFASILQSIMRRYWEAQLSCPKCHYTWTSSLPESYLNLKKVDFFWINRDQKSFEWFVNLLSELEIEQAEQGSAMERFLDMHMYITSALQKTDMKAVGLHLALDLLHEKEKRDLITGLKTRTHPGRPNWNRVFRQIAQQKKGRVTVFFCGPPQLAKTLKLKCEEFGFLFKKEVF